MFVLRIFSFSERIAVTSLRVCLNLFWKSIPRSLLSSVLSSQSIYSLILSSIHIVGIMITAIELSDRAIKFLVFGIFYRLYSILGVPVCNIYMIG